MGDGSGQRILNAAMSAALDVAASYGAQITPEARRRALNGEKGSYHALGGELLCRECSGWGHDGDGQKCRGRHPFGCSENGRAVCQACDAVVRVGSPTSCDCPAPVMQ